MTDKPKAAVRTDGISNKAVIRRVGERQNGPVWVFGVSVDTPTGVKGPGSATKANSDPPPIDTLAVVRSALRRTFMLVKPASLSKASTMDNVPVAPPSVSEAVTVSPAPLEYYGT